MQEASYEALPEDRVRLIEAAVRAMDTAYSPYSGFSVGAALLTTGGDIITGSNVENAAYGSTICAERAALLRANAMGHRAFTAIAVIARGRDGPTLTVTAPCGACRQMLFEASCVGRQDFEVILASTGREKIIVTTINELLPLPFGPKISADGH
jgi:cytidine deaminase